MQAPMTPIVIVIRFLHEDRNVRISIQSAFTAPSKEAGSQMSSFCSGVSFYLFPAEIFAPDYAKIMIGIENSW